MEHTYDSIGRPKEVIVIQDSTSPIPKKRTRAAVAAAAAAADAKWASANDAPNGTSTTAAAAQAAAASKKRKAEEEEALAKKKKPLSGHRVPALPPTQQTIPQQLPAATRPAQPQPPAWDDPEGHYIVKPDDIIGGRCKSTTRTRLCVIERKLTKRR
jgi:dual-specificity kinase